MMKRFSAIYTYLVMPLMLTALMASCMEAPQNNRSLQTDEDSISKEVEDPEFETSSAYISYAGVKYDGVFELDNYFDDIITIRGGGIHSYIKENPTKVFCAITDFSSLNSGTPLVAVGYPQYTYNASDNTKEYFIRFTYRKLDEQASINYCDTTQVKTFMTLKNSSMNQLNTKHAIDTLCPTCSNIIGTSTNFYITTSDGDDISTATSNDITFRLFFRYIGTPDDSNICSSNDQCSTNGSDFCCLNGQCVKDLSEKVDSIPNTVLNEVSINIANIYKYPEYYNICTTGTPPTTDPDEDFTPEESRQNRFREMQNLYNCTTPFDGERGICTVTYEGARTDLTPSFETVKNDSNFAYIYKGTNPLVDSIHEVRYQNQTIYTNSASVVTGEVTMTGTNDNSIDTTKLAITTPYNADNKYKSLQISSYADVSCTRINNFQAQCYKEYVQGQNIGFVTDHFPGTQRFEIPRYADMNSKVVVEIDDVARTQGTSWDVEIGAINEVVFKDQYKVQDSQKLRIDFYVDLSTYPNILEAKEQAQAEIASICKCSLSQCYLEEVMDTSDNVIDYQCKLVETQTPAPLQQSFFLSAKTAPQRYFDLNGVPKKDLTLTDIIIEPNLAQEGSAFSYENRDKSTPNNINNYIGFSEIYGSFDLTAESAKEAKEVVVEEGNTYDIFIQNGLFSGCSSCGNDYYNPRLKVIPNEFNHGAAGYQPDLETTSRDETDKYRSDDYLFGRACFVPATMLPWTHNPNEDAQIQRLNRMKAQHFMYANGYNRDWYGFNYGSVIGSFDGVKWFAVGTKRRIKATSNKLFLAINASFSDLTSENSYSVLVQDSVINGTISLPTTDFETDGATCQQVHECNTDSDCASSLGWDYMCENVSTLSSSYPNFDINGNEIPQETDIDRILSLNGPFSGSTKRCVYRGRGAACAPRYNETQSSDASYTSNPTKRLHGCSFNNHCSELDAGDNQKFNNKISRFAISLPLFNGLVNDDSEKVSTYGLEAPTIGRPFKYKGDEAPTFNALQNLRNNEVNAICIPGRDPDEQNPTDSMDLYTENKSDVIGNMGSTIDLLGSNLNPAVFASCPTLDIDGNYIAFDRSNDVSTLNSKIELLSRSQNLSTEHLEIFSSFTNEELISNVSQAGVIIESKSLAENACLRAPGSTCFTDLDCSAPKFVSDNIKSIDIIDMIGKVSQYELNFWQTEMVCSQPAKSTDSDYDIRNNRCCSEVGNTFKLPTMSSAGEPITSDPAFSSADAIKQNEVPGAEINVDDPQRFSGNVLTEYERTAPSNEGGENLLDLIVNVNDSAGVNFSSTEYQFKTLSTYGKKMCCTENWIRQFDADENGGGHEWGPNKMQAHQKGSLEDFKCYNYADESKQNCEIAGDNAKNPNLCSLVDIPDPIALDITKWLGYLELAGIPNVVIKDHTAFKCKEADGVTPRPIYRADSTGHEYTDGSDEYYSLGDLTNFTRGSDTNFDEPKKVFSSDEFACCQPAGTQMDASDDDSMCCTGYKNPQNNKCQLKNFSNVTAYTNRFVSSELQTLQDNEFEPTTGQIKDREKLAVIACQREMCAEGFVGFGLAHGQYGLPDELLADADGAGVGNVKRFLENDDKDNELGRANFFLDGLKWNDNVYCLPANVAGALQGATPAVQVLSCN